MRFGDYSFTIEVYGPVENGTTRAPIPGYAFPHPVNITLGYDPRALGANASGYVPTLQLFNKTSQTWEDARDTCNPPFESVDTTENTFTVSVCHLTQVTS